MSRLGNISGKEAVRIFGKIGYFIERQSASHIILQSPGKPVLVIPDHKELAPNLLRSQIKLANLTEDEFLELKRK
ncbi:MAG: type II toxin-antitoxin system HicA family toxin [Armatimonadetes bacterium]|nr:type II toxin-antitoxin system HicA family toxin [Armatimonadota bacterium]